LLLATSVASNRLRPAAAWPGDFAKADRGGGLTGFPLPTLPWRGRRYQALLQARHAVGRAPEDDRAPGMAYAGPAFPQPPCPDTRTPAVMPRCASVRGIQ